MSDLVAKKKELKCKNLEILFCCKIYGKEKEKKRKRRMNENLRGLITKFIDEN